MPPGRKNTVERFWSLVRKCDGCWLWDGVVHPTGYGRFRLDAEQQAHRVSFALTNGPIAKGVLICHRCDNKLCVNPDHLYAGTSQSNADDAFERRRIRLGEAHRDARLTRAQVMEIRERRRRGEQTLALAEEFGVSGVAITKIATGISWRWLPRIATLKEIGAAALRLAKRDPALVELLQNEIQRRGEDVRLDAFDNGEVTKTG